MTQVEELLVSSFKRRLMSRVAYPPSGCWEYTGELSKNGYGIIYIESQKLLAHRASYQVFIGAIPENMLVCHSCDNKKCINPAHLSIGTHQDNMDDMRKRGRAASGERSGVYTAKNAKLDKDKVRTIRTLYQTGHSRSEIAATFDIHRSTVGRIISRKKWAHVA